MKEFALIFRLEDISSFKPSPKQMDKRMNWLGSIAAQNKLVDKGNTVLVIEHNMPFLMGISDEVIVMENGKFLMQDVPAKVQKDKRVLAAYLGG